MKLVNTFKSLLDVKAIKVHEEFFLPEEMIVEEGTAGDQLYFLCDGKLVWLRKRFNYELLGKSCKFHTNFKL